MKKTFAVLAGIVALPLLAAAEPPFTLTDTVVVNARIDVIDHDARELTLVDTGGGTATVRFGPEIDSFDRLTVGDTATFRYYESVAYAIRKPGQPSGLPAETGTTTITRGQGARPSGTIARQETATVTIKAIDPKVPSVTVVTEDGRTVSFKVEGKKNLNDVKVGDKVEITYTEAVMINVK
jgi:Cu/Ag efflux protein CusF